MHRIIKQVFFALLIILFFILLPRYEAEAIPEEIDLVLGGEVRAFIKTLEISGVVLALLSLMKIASESSALNLLACAGSELVWLYLFLFFIGLGDVSSFGTTQKHLALGGGATIFMDFKFFAISRSLVAGVKILKAGLGFYYARKSA